MKYPVTVSKVHDELYVACCPMMHQAYGFGKDADQALDRLQAYFFLYLHDTEAEMDIVEAEDRSRTGSSDPLL